MRDASTKKSSHTEHTMLEDEHEQAETAKNSRKLQFKLLDCRTAGLQDLQGLGVVLGKWARTVLNANPFKGTNASSDTAGLGSSWVEDVPSRDPCHSCVHLRSIFGFQEFKAI